MGMCREYAYTYTSDGATLVLRCIGACPGYTSTFDPGPVPWRAPWSASTLALCRRMPLPLRWAGHHPGHGTTTTLGRSVIYSTHENRLK